MINIYSADGNVLMQADITKDAKREEELSKSDYISLSFNAAVNTTLPAGAYIEHTYHIDELRTATRHFLLLEPYEPVPTNEMSWKYTPNFQHPKMALGKVPFFVRTQNSQNEEIKQTVWNFVGTPAGIMDKVCDFLNTELEFGNKGWRSVISGEVSNSVSISFSDTDVLSALSSIATAMGDNCEWHIDYDNEVIYVGKIAIGDGSTILKVGINVGAPSISESKEDYYNSFFVFGGTRNITQVNSKGENISAGDIRLQLAQGSGSIDVNGREMAYSINQYSLLDLRQDTKTEPLMTGVLNFSDVFPSLNTYVYNVRGREKYVINSTTNQKVPLVYNADGSVVKYKTFTVWYMRLAYCTESQENGKILVNTTTEDGKTLYWYDFEITDNLVVNGKTLSCSFEPNFSTGALTTPLAGRGTNGEHVGFELTYHKNAATVHDADDVSSSYFKILAGDYEIIYQEDNGLIIPTNATELLIPKGDNLPNKKCNITVLYNIAMSDVYKASAQRTLLNTAIKEITRRLSNLNNYTVKSYPQVFAAHNPRLQIGQKVTYDDGNGYQQETRVLKLSTNIDYDFVQDITVGNQAIKGTITQLKEDVQSIITGSTGSGGALSVSQMNNIIASYGAKHFLSKISPDTAQELLTFLKGIAVGGGKKGIDAEGVATLRAVLSEGFKSAAGILGAGFWLGEKEDADGNTYSYLEVDRMLVRKVAEFVQLMIRDIRHVGGQLVLTPAAVEVTTVERLNARGEFIPLGVAGEVATYRCHFRTEQDGKTITNDFAVGDLARCQTFNMKGTGLTLNGANRYYWRKVTAVGDDYIDLSNSDYDRLAQNSEPQEGDEIVQMGNATDTSRQGVILLSAYGADAPKIALYRGVNSYSLADKAVVSLSADEVMIIADRLMYRTSDGKTQSVAEGLDTLTESVTSITADMKGITARVESTEKTVTEHGDEIAKVDSKITQEAGRIALEVNRTTLGMENMLEGSSFDPYAEGPVVTAQRVDGYKGAGGIMALNTTSANLQGARWVGSGKQGNIRVEKGKTYTFGVWVKSGGTNGTVRVDVVWQGSRTDTSRPAGMAGPGTSANLINKAATTDWELLTATFTVAADAPYEWVEVYLFNRSDDGNSLATTFSRPILAEGDTYRGWGLAPGEKSDTENKLLATGIDIESQTITATADTFKIRNNKGETTASVNKDGLFETNDAIIKGTVMAKDGYFSGFVMKEPCVITPENIKQYGTISTESAYGYATLDFTKTGSYIIVNGDFSNVVGSGNELVLMLPYGGTGDGTATTLPDGTTLPVPEMLRYMDQKIVIVNASGKDIGVNAAAVLGTVQGYPRDSSIAVAQIAVLEPTISLSGSATSGKYTYKVGWSLKKANIKS